MGFLGRLFGREQKEPKVQPVTNEQKVEPVKVEAVEPVEQVERVKINNRNVRRNLLNRITPKIKEVPPPPRVIKPLFNNSRMPSNENIKKYQDYMHKEHKYRVYLSNKESKEKKLYGITKYELEKVAENILRNFKSKYHYPWDKVLSERDFQILLSNKEVDLKDWRLTTLNKDDWELNNSNPNESNPNENEFKREENLREKFKNSYFGGSVNSISKLIPGSKIYRQILTPDEEREYEIVKALREQLKNPPISKEVYDKLLHYKSITFDWNKYTNEKGEIMYKRSLIENTKKIDEFSEKYSSFCWKDTNHQYLGKYRYSKDIVTNRNQYHIPLWSYTTYIFDKGEKSDEVVASTECDIIDKRNFKGLLNRTGLTRNSRKSKARKMRRNTRRK